MSVEVIVPWSPGCPHRDAAWRWVRARHKAVSLGRPATLGVLVEGPWCKARAIMPAVAASAAEIIVVADADVWCDGIEDAVQAVRAGAPWAIPHAQVHRLAEAGTAAVLAGEAWQGQPLAQPPYYGVAGGGIVIAPREVILSIPLDPRFVGWGRPARKTSRGRWRSRRSPASHGAAPPRSFTSGTRRNRGYRDVAAPSRAGSCGAATCRRATTRPRCDDSSTRHSMLSTLINRPCTIWSRTSSGDIDELGDATDTDTATSTVCELQQRQRSEPAEEGEFSDTSWLLILPAGTAIDTGDAVEVDGATYEVVGAPWEARNPRTHLASHIEATVRRTAGAETGS